MENRNLRPYIIVVCLMAATSLALAVSVDTSLTDEAGISMELPDTFAEWTGSTIRFCQEPECRRSFLAEDLEDVDVCSACTNQLHNMSLMEANLLPHDTGMLKKQYRHPTGRIVNLGVVLSGKERGSIHRPEVCQTGQGRDLVSKHVLDVEIPGRKKPLKVMVLELEQIARSPDGQQTQVGSYYAYWFVGKDRETPYHHMRMFLMASDRVLRNVAHRWAYVSASGIREIGSSDYEDEIREVISALYPHMKLGES